MQSEEPQGPSFNAGILCLHEIPLAWQLSQPEALLQPTTLNPETTMQSGTGNNDALGLYNTILKSLIPE